VGVYRLDVHSVRGNEEEVQDHFRNDKKKRGVGFARGGEAELELGFTVR